MCRDAFIRVRVPHDRVGGTNIDKHLPPPGVEYHAQEQPDELCIFASKGLDVVELSLP